MLNAECRKAFLCFLLALLPMCGAHSGEIAWKVVNRFPLFKNDESFIALEQQKRADESIGAFLLKQDTKDLRRLLPIQDTFWEPQRGVYNRKIFLPLHRVMFSYAGVRPGQSCSWLFNGEILNDSRCDRIEVTYPEDKSFSMEVRPSDENVVSITGKIETELILGFGDSFASGEGNPDHPVTYTGNPKTDSLTNPDWFQQSPKGHSRFAASAMWWDHACHRSLLSWQGLFALERAMKDRTKVVRFVSFSCSGAEIYGGFFRAQQAPPGANVYNLKTVRNLRVNGPRDGGNGYEWFSDPNTVGNAFRKLSRDGKVAVRKSQLNAAMEFLCDGEMAATATTVRFHEPDESASSNVIFGDFTYKECHGTMRQPQFVLLTFGGNDFGFSGIVSGAITPDVTRKKWNPLGKVGLYLVRKDLFKVVAPTIAKAKIETLMDPLYQDLNDALFKFLRVDSPGKIHMLVYPDPLPSDSYPVCSDRLGEGNEALGQLVATKGYGLTTGWPFTLEEDRALQVRKTFISSLQQKQRSVINAKGWKVLESQAGFEAPGGPRTFCSVSADCNHDACPVGDRFGWATTSSKDEWYTMPRARLPTLQRASDWRPYDPARSRGLRTANDAVMTQATFLVTEKHGMIQEDWRYGIAHPTANVHEAIARHLEKSLSDPGAEK